MIKKIFLDFNQWKEKKVLKHYIFDNCQNYKKNQQFVIFIL